MEIKCYTEFKNFYLLLEKYVVMFYLYIKYILLPSLGEIGLLFLETFFFRKHLPLVKGMHDWLLWA